MALKDPIFAPKDDQVPLILEHLNSPFASLDDVAASNNTNVAALSAWLMTDEIQEHQRTTDAAAIHRARSLAARQLHTAVNLLTFIIEASVEEERTAPPLNDELKPPPYATSKVNPPRRALVRLRARDTARKSVELLLVITRLNPAPH